MIAILKRSCAYSVRIDASMHHPGEPNQAEAQVFARGVTKPPRLVDFEQSWHYQLK